MAYITVDELLLALDKDDVAQLSNDENGEIQAEENITPAINSASGVCDSYIGVRYTVPIAEPDYAVKSACTRIAVYFLHLRRAWTVSETVKDAYDSAISWLKSVSKGEAILPIPPATRASNSTGYFGGETRVFQGKSHDNQTDNMHGF